jgi:hypothetical protein
MRKRRLTTCALAAALLTMAAARAGAVVEVKGCCCIAGAGGQACAESTEKECLAKQQAAPQYDQKNSYDAALKKSQAEDAGTMKSGWKEGKCDMR